MIVGRSRWMSNNPPCRMGWSPPFSICCGSLGSTPAVMSKFLNDIQAANLRYAEGVGEEATLSTRSAHRFSILTCMEAWLDPGRFAGATPCQGHVVRNAGGRATGDAIRSLFLSYKLLDAREWFVVHHKDCDLGAFAEPAHEGSGNRRNSGFLGKRRLADDSQGVEGPRISDDHARVVAEVRRLRRHPLVSNDITIYGYLFDVRSGKLQEVPEATIAGAPRQMADPPAAGRRAWPHAPSLRRNPHA